MRINVVRPNENFRGMSYSEWVTAWSNWLLSEDPDSYDGTDMLFLRGNVNYKSVGDSEAEPRHIDPRGIYDRTGQSGERIFEGTSIFIPVIVSMFSIGDIYEGTKIKTPQQLRYITNIDTDRSGSMWATIMKKGERRAYKIVDNIKDYRVATPLFKLIVPENSFLMDKTDVPTKPGIYDTVSVGFFLLIRSLTPSTYRINFGGNGVGGYYTNSLYDISVEGKRRDSLKDESNPIITFKQPWI
jgi:hypothetical protein